MNLREDAVSSLTAAGLFNIDLDSPKYADFVATHLSNAYRSYVASDDYVQEVVDYSGRPEVIDEAVETIGDLGSEIGRKKYGHSIKFNVDPLKEDLKCTFGKKYHK